MQELLGLAKESYDFLMSSLNIKMVYVMNRGVPWLTNSLLPGNSCHLRIPI